MSRLNATIKMIVMLGNLFFLFASAAFTIGAGLVFSGKFMPLKYDEATKAAVAVLMVSVFVLICTFSGCCGAIHQVKRSGENGVRYNNNFASLEEVAENSLAVALFLISRFVRRPKSTFIVSSDAPLPALVQY